MMLEEWQYQYRARKSLIKYSLLNHNRSNYENSLTASVKDSASILIAGCRISVYYLENWHQEKSRFYNHSTRENFQLCIKKAPFC